MKKLLATLGLVLVTACTASAGGGGTNPPVINDFQAAPGLIKPGESATLSWDVSDATTVEIDKGVGVVTGSSTTVKPTATTTYTLKATNGAGFTTSTAKVTVTNGIALPAITSFTASPTSVAIGNSVTLSWSVTGQFDTLKLDPGSINLLSETTNGAGSHLVTNVTADTTFTLTATNPGGSVTAQAAVTARPAGATQFTYTDPVSPTAKLKLVRNAALSTNTHLVLDLKVGTAALGAFGVALTIPFSAASAGMISFPSNGLTQSASFNVGTSPTTAGAKLVTSGTALPNTFTVGVAKHKQGANDTADVSFNPGDTLLSLAFEFGTTTPVPGTTVFTGTALQANPKFRAAALKYDGAVVAGKADIAVGDFLITN